ncbi:MAG: alanine racemase [Acidobacteria bacterium]|jgi:D-serine deaminase-like pyridoxal phosphate-dependent protein|nr:alanine racemase [Acidobacteriota bacterium]
MSLLPRTPYPIVSGSRLAANIQRMQALATHAGVQLRPHTKTHKSPVIALMQLDAGASGVCCAKLSEAEIFADAGITDIRLPYPVNPSNADRVLSLLDRVTLSIIVDDEAVAAEWSRAMTAAGRTLNVLVKVDVGFHRCGVNPDASDVVGAITRIAALPGLSFRGLLSHAGQAYNAESPYALAAITARETGIMTGLATRLRTSGVAVEEISVGSTPTASFAPSQRGITEMRPGNYVFLDRTQVGLAAATYANCALTIVATVVSRPAPDRAILDCGSKTLTSDGARGFTPLPGFGAVFVDLDSVEPDPTIVIDRVSEEHAVCRVPEDSPLRPGHRVRVLPNHACTVTNLMDQLWLADDQGALTPLPVAARGRIW